VLAEALPDDLPCPNEPTAPVAFRCPNCGRGARTVCTVHARAIAAGSLFCDLCHLAGEVAYLTAEPNAAKEAS
jgi:transcription elongation factor Elf1